MILDLLSPTEKEALIDLALLAMRADRNVAESELELLEELRLAIGLEAAAFAARVAGRPDKAWALSAFASAESRRLAFLELVLVAFVDGTFEPSEHVFLTEVQAALGISDRARDRCFAWALKMAELRTQAQAIVAGQGG